MASLYDDVDRELGDAEDEEAGRLLTLLSDEIGTIEDEALRRQMAEDQALRMGRLLKNLKSTQTELEAHKLETDGKVKAIEARVATLRAWTFNLLEQAGLQKAKDALVTVYTSGEKPGWDVINEAEIPPEFVRVFIKTTLRTAAELGITDWIDRQEVSKTALEENFVATGELVPGAVRVTDRKHLVVR